MTLLSIGEYETNGWISPEVASKLRRALSLLAEEETKGPNIGKPEVLDHLIAITVIRRAQEDPTDPLVLLLSLRERGEGRLFEMFGSER